MSRKKKTGPFMAMKPVVEGAWKERKERERKALESVGFRKVDDLDRQADEILRKADREMLEAMAANVQTLCEGFAELKLPSNDPEYIKRLQASEAARNAIANHIRQIDIVPDGAKSYLGVGSFNHHEALELARRLAEHFETKIRQHQ